MDAGSNQSSRIPFNKRRNPILGIQHGAYDETQSRRSCSEFGHYKTILKQYESKKAIDDENTLQKMLLGKRLE